MWKLEQDLDKTRSGAIMKKSLLVIWAIFGLTTIVSSQTSTDAPLPPPAPVIFQAPTEKELKEFTPANGLFSAIFPGAPKESSIALPNEAGTIVTYVMKRMGASTFIGVAEYEIDIAARPEKIYAVFRNQIASKNGTLQKEDEIVRNGRTGREFQCLFGIVFRRTQIFLVKNRMFEADYDVTNWHIIDDKVKAEWNAEADRFFDSFRIK